MRTLLIHIVLLFAGGVLLAGCAIGGAASNERRLQALEREGEELRESVEAVRESLEKLRAGIEALDRSAEELKLYMEMPERIRQGAARVGRKLDSIEGKLERLERQDPAAVRVKVLRGDGVPGSAREAAVLLRRRGYDVGGVGVAPSDGFEVDTVFYAEGFEAAAGAIARELGQGNGSKTRTRPLTWSSVYDVIVVTGGNN